MRLRFLILNIVLPLAGAVRIFDEILRLLGVRNLPFSFVQDKRENGILNCKIALNRFLVTRDLPI